MTNISFGKEAEKMAKLIGREMPAVTFVIWDLTPFIPHLHNWRKNIIFVECDKAAVDSLAEKLSVEYPDYDIYAGVKKPKIKISRGNAEASIVITAREGKERREVSGSHPKIEKCLVDMLYYSRNEILPLSLNDVLDLWSYYLAGAENVEDLIKGPTIRFSEIYRYSLRRYLGWFVSIFAFKLSKKMFRSIDKRHLTQGRKNLELIRMVDKLE